jgi:hypothetical protein
MAKLRISETERARRRDLFEGALKAGHPPPGLVTDKPGALGVAAAQAGLGAPTLRSWLNAEQRVRREGLEHYAPDLEFYKPPAAQAGPALAVESAELRTRRRLEAELARLRRQVKELADETNAQEDIGRAAALLVEPPPTPPRWAVSSSPATTGPGFPVLFTSDFQWGEVIDENELDGINRFDSKVAEARYRRLIERTIDLAFNHMVKPAYPGIYYLRGGDTVSGNIHDELRETNDLHALPASRDVVEKEIWGIEQLAKRFGKVRVVSVPGNHGRTTRKPHSKRYALHNYDFWIARAIEDWFTARGDQRVSFYTPLSGDALFKIHGYQFLLTHGDRIGSRGGQGFIGPAATIARGMKKLRDYYAELGSLLDFILVGHFHTALELEYGWSNGCLPGASEYSRDGRFSPKAPCQWLFFVHPKYGVSARWKIFLERQPKVTAT